MAIKASGLYLDEFVVGETYISNARTVTEADVVNFAGVSGDFNPLHMDEEFGKSGGFGKRVAHGALGFIMCTGFENQMGLYMGTCIAFVEFTCRYTAPLCIGDTVHAEIEITEVKPSSKRPDRGILKQTARLVNQEGKVIMEAHETLMMKRKNA